jgi:hypothetical protein
MHFFRSEEHLRNWAHFDAEKEAGIIPFEDLVKLFSADFFRRRLDPDYLSHMQGYVGGFLMTLKEIGKTGPFWLP